MGHQSGWQTSHDVIVNNNQDPARVARSYLYEAGTLISTRPADGTQAADACRQGVLGGGGQVRGVVRAADMGLGGVRRGDSVWLAGLSSGHTLVRRRSSVITATQATSIAHPKVPRFRAIHQEARPRCSKSSQRPLLGISRFTSRPSALLRSGSSTCFWVCRRQAALAPAGLRLTASGC